jgi:hypothetical protein
VYNRAPEYVSREIEGLNINFCNVSVFEFLATDPEVRVRFPALPDFLRSGGPGTESTQPPEYN